MIAADNPISPLVGDSQEPDIAAPTVISTEWLALVERIAASRAFSKSSRLPPLLRYLADCTLKHDRAGLSEQAIGRAVFGKQSDFSPTEDSSVRVYVRQLRLRLHEYYQSAGEHEAVVIDIPKGGYSLSFHPRHLQELPSTPAPTTFPAALPESQSSERQRTLRHEVFMWLPWCLFVLAVLAALFAWRRGAQMSSIEATPWPLDQVIQAGQQTTLVLADGSYALRLLGEREVTLDEYADHRYAAGLIPKAATEGELRLFHYIESSQITSMADAHATASIITLSGDLRKNIAIRSAKDLKGEMLAHGNFIFVGAKTSNPWTELFESRLNFPLVEAGLRGSRYVLNRHPLPGEQLQYSITGPTGHSGEDYATISLIPGTDGTSAVLLLQGLRLEGTEAAIRYLSSASDRAAMAQRLRAANGGKLPRHFEVLLHAHSMGGSAASIECVAVRAIL